MKLVSVNVGSPREVLDRRGRKVLTSIFRRAVPGPVLLRADGLDGDVVSDLDAHGGPEKAAYIYSIDNYRYWQRELDRDDFVYGQFGENLTVEGMTDGNVYIGDVFRIGGAVVEVTQARMPCFKLGIRMGDPGFPKRFLMSPRTGFYVRVVEEGEVRVGDTFQREVAGPERVSVREAVDLLYRQVRNPDGLVRLARIPALSASWRARAEDLAEQETAKVKL